MFKKFLRRLVGLPVAEESLTAKKLRKLQDLKLPKPKTPFKEVSEPKLTQVRFKDDEELKGFLDRLKAPGRKVTTYEPRCLVCSDNLLYKEATDKIVGTELPVMTLTCKTCGFYAQSSVQPPGPFLSAFEKKKKKDKPLDLDSGPDGKLLN